MKKLIAWLFIIAFIFTAKFVFAANGESYRPGITKDAKAANIETQKFNKARLRDERRARARAKKAAQKQQKELKRRLKQAERETKKKNAELARIKNARRNSNANSHK